MDEYEEHPTQKPEALLGRFSIGIELQEAYVKTGLRRLGIRKQFRGEKLLAPRKSYQRKSHPAQANLFEP